MSLTAVMVMLKYRHLFDSGWSLPIYIGKELSASIYYFHRIFIIYIGAYYARGYLPLLHYDKLGWLEVFILAILFAQLVKIIQNRLGIKLF